MEPLTIVVPMSSKNMREETWMDLSFGNPMVFLKKVGGGGFRVHLGGGMSGMGTLRFM